MSISNINSKYILIITILEILFDIYNSYDIDLWAIIISTSNGYDNYRHSVNNLIIYNYLRKNGVPDERIILSLGEYPACKSRNRFPGEMKFKYYLKMENCQENIDIDFKDDDVNSYQILDILKGKKMKINGGSYRQLKSNKNSRILIIISGHGGEKILAVKGKMNIFSNDLNNALNEMYIKQKYKELLIILDTCEASSLFDNVNVPNVYFVASSLTNQPSLSDSIDPTLMLSSSTEFHINLFSRLNESNGNSSLSELFNFNTYEREHSHRNKNMKNKKKYMKDNNDNIQYEIKHNKKNKKKYNKSGILVRNKLGRRAKIKDFFGDGNMNDDHSHNVIIYYEEWERIKLWKVINKENDEKNISYFSNITQNNKSEFTLNSIDDQIIIENINMNKFINDMEIYENEYKKYYNNNKIINLNFDENGYITNIYFDVYYNTGYILMFIIFCLIVYNINKYLNNIDNRIKV